MRLPTAAQLLYVWERGQAWSLPARAVALLAAASPDLTSEDVASLSIGERDRRLLSLREGLFGSTVIGVVTCPQCGERLELSFAVSDIQVPALSAHGETTLTAEGYALAFRLPTSEDLLRLSLVDTAAASRQILTECVIAEREGQLVAPDALPATVVETVVAAMAAADPQADIRLSLVCFACQHAWDAVFDIASFLWEEIETWAQRVLIEIHLLARAYGWTEAEILGLSARRRRVYLEMVQQ